MARNRLVTMIAVYLAVAAALTLASSGAQAAAATTYEYDSLGRLVRVVYDDGASISYTYDVNGNRVQIDVQTDPAGAGGAMEWVIPLLL
jgi:YD repeat-containing protein